MISTQHLRAHVPSLMLIATVAFASTGCFQQTSSNANQALTSGTGGGGGSGGSTSGSPTPNAAGLVASFDPTASNITGWAYDAGNPSISFYVELWLNGPRGSGTPLGQILANTGRFLFPQGPYGFNFIVPMAYQDGKIRQIYAYAIDPNTAARNDLGGSPMGFWAGVNPTGMAFWNSTMSPVINSKCTACHSIGDYLTEKDQLANPTRFNTGSATNNDLINTALGGNNHGGGNRCGTAAGSPCAEMQQWWAAEFN